MAQRRMFSLKVIDTDNFLDMPQTTQLLYYNLAMRADDDGFVANPRRIIKMTSGNPDDLKVLIGKRYIIPFEKGICVIRHWRIHNYIRKERHTPTEYVEEISQLAIKNGKYEKMSDKLSDTGKVRLGKDRIGNSKRGFRPPTYKEVFSYCKERKNTIDAERFIDFYSAKGWYIGKNKMKDWKAAVRTWENKGKSNKGGLDKW